jgi:hypothetical protein
MKSKPMARASVVVAFALLAMLIPIQHLFAQGGGSIFTRYGLGDLQYYENSAAVGMGGAGLSTLPVTVIDAENPANWSQINLTRFSLGGDYQGISVADNSSSSHFGYTGFNGAAFALPLSPPSGFVVSIGVAPYSVVRYDVLTTPPTSAEFGSSTLEYVGQGGINFGWFGASYNLSSSLHVGARVKYYFGTIQNSITQTFDSSVFQGSTDLRNTQFRGVAVTFGAVYSGLSKILNLGEKNSLNLGAVVTTSSNLSVNENQVITATTAGQVTSDTINTSLPRVKIPLSYGFGASYGTSRLLLAADALFQNWSGTSYPGILLPAENNSNRFGAGIELLPVHEPNLSLWRRSIYRLGAYEHTTYYQINGQSINETAVTGGWGFTIMGETHLDLGLEYVVRGTTDYSLEREKLLRFTFTLSGADLWFIKPPPED